MNRTIKYIGAGTKASSKNNPFVSWILRGSTSSFSTVRNMYPIVVDVDSLFLILTIEIQDSMEPARRSWYRGEKRPIGQVNAIPEASW